MAFRRRNKSYPFFSQEFLIQNHADIVFSLVIFILIGLMFEATAKTAILFIQPQYNVSTLSPEGEVTFYHYGWRDCATILFYFFITIILHAVVQEYVLDVEEEDFEEMGLSDTDCAKVNRRLHLSKSKNTKFNESGQLCVFHLVSSVWSLYILVTEGYLLHPSSLWENYPHVHLRFQVKFFYLTQLAYWLHALPELYFQKVRKEEIPRQLQHVCLYLLHIVAAYLLNLSRVGLVLLFLQYVSELGFHIARLFYFTDENHQKMFDLWAASFVFTRMVTLTLMFLAVGFGLARAENQGLDLEMGNFNTVLIRMAVLLLVCLIQSWLLWKFIRFQLRRWREFRHKQDARKKAAPKPALRPLKRDSQSSEMRSFHGDGTQVGVLQSRVGADIHQLATMKTGS